MARPALGSRAFGLNTLGLILLGLMAPALLGPASRPAAAQGDELAAQRLFFEAQRLEQEGDAEGALREYGVLVQRFPATAQAPQALLRQAWLEVGRGNPKNAQDLVQRLIDGYPDDATAAGAYVLLGRLRADAPASQNDLEQARAELGRVPLLFGRDAYPDLPARSEARVRAGEISLGLGAYQDAAASFVSAIEEETPSPWTARARFGLARVLLADGQWVAAADVLQRIVTTSAAALPEGDPQWAEVARRRLTLVHRLRIRPAAGRPRWSGARLLSLPGVLLKKPVGIAARDDGRLVIADDGQKMALVVSTTGVVESRVPVDDPGLPWWNGEEAYLPAGSRVHLLISNAAQGFPVYKGKERQPAEGLWAGARGQFGQWYLLDRDTDSVLGYAPVGGRPGVLAGGDPQDLALDSRDRVYVLDRKANTVVRLRPDGGSDGIVARGDWDRPQALAIDPLDNLYVLDRGNAQVLVFDPEGKRLEVLGPQLPGGIELRSPQDLAVDGSGRLWIADSKLAAVVVVE